MRPLLLSAVLLAAAAATAQTPDIDVVPEDVSVELIVGEQTTRAVLIENGGGAPLTFRVRTAGDAGAGVVYAINDYGPTTVYGINPSSGAVLSRAPVSVNGLPAFDGGTLYVLSGATLFTVDPATGRQTGSVTLQTTDGYYYSVYDVAAADGQVVVVAQGQQGFRLDEFDPNSGALLRSIPLALEARTVAAGAGVFYVTGRDPEAGDVLVTLDAASGQRTRTAAFPRTRSLTYSRALRALLTLGDQSDRAVRLYDAATGTYLSTFNLPVAEPYGYAYYNGIAADEGAEAPWLSVSPRAGTIAPGGQIGATLTVDAGRVVDGTYTADVIVASNDPDEPEVTLPVSLVAIGAPAVAVSPEAVAFGVAYVGTPVTRRVTVRNPGSDTLLVSGVAVSDDRLSVSAGAFALAPADSLVLDLTLTPTGAGPLDATLALATNVEGAERVVVAVTAADVFPPVLAVAPDALAVEGEAGAMATATLTVSNEGDGPLTYGVFAGLTAEVIPVRMPENAASGPRQDVASLFESLRQSEDPPPGGPGDDPAPGDSTGSVGAPALNVLVSDEDGNAVVDLLAVRGAIDGDSLYLALDFAAVPDRIDFAALLDLDTDPTTSYYCCYGGIGAEAEVGGYVYRDGYSGRYFGEVRAYQYGADQSYYGASFAVVGNALVVAVPLSAIPDLGRAFDFVLQTSGEFYGSYQYGTDLAPNEGVVAVRSAPWLSVSPGTGTVAAGASAEVVVSLDAAGLYGGVYDGVIVVEGNGPETQRETVPVTFSVTGVPVASAAGAVALGEVFVGHASAQTLVIENTGTDNLTVTGVESSDAAVSAFTREPLDLGPGQSGAYSVTVTATEAGPVEATLTFETNSPDGPLVVAVTATAVLPPVAALSAAAVAVEVRAGETAEAVVTLANTGGSPLTYRARVASAAARADGQDVAGWRPESGGPARAAVHQAALARVGAVGPAAFLVSTGDLPTLLIDPDEGLATDVIEVRGELLADGRTVALELVFARLINAYDLDGTLYLDTDRKASTGYPAELAGVQRALGTDLTVSLYEARYGRVYVYRSGSPYVSQYVSATVDGASVRFDLPLSYVGDGAFDFVGMTYGYGGTDVFPNAGVASLDTRLSWLAVSPDEGSVSADGTVEVRLTVDASDLAPGTYEVVLQVSTNDPARPVMEVPVTVEVTAGVPVEEAAPAAFALSAPAPNPTRGATRLAYALPEPAAVSVEVFDAVGRRVAVLDQGSRSAGSHVADLDAAGLPAGVYSVRLRAGAHVAVQRLSVVR